MIKRKKIIVGIFVVLFVTLGCFKLKEYVAIKNVSDEMYKEEISFYYKGKPTGFPMMEQIENWDRKNFSENNSLLRLAEMYKLKYLEEGETIIISFDYPDESFTIGYMQDISEEVTLRIFSDYSVETKLLKQYLSVSTTNSDISEPKTAAEIQAYLTEYGITKDYLQKKSNEILYDRVLTDWVSSTEINSRFSMDNLGGFTIEKDEFLTD